MPARQVLIVHGWSDTSAAFHALAKFLGGHGYAAKEIWLGDYISMDDDVRVADVGKRMGEVIDALMASGALNASFDMIVHSTGGLVAREWLTTRYRGVAETCPMRRLVMLAPANFGSRLAALGKSFLGRVVRGYDHWFHTGTAMLNDLELASAYQCELAQRDILVVPGEEVVSRYYGADRVWPFVITGSHPYAGLFRQISNEDGGDGTVRVCAANLNARGVTIDFSQPNKEMVFSPWASRLECEIPLAVLPTRTHASIIDPERADTDESIEETAAEQAQLGAMILEALGCQDFSAYRAIRAKWEAVTEQTADRRNHPGTDSAEFFHQYLQANFYVTDDQGRPVSDYFLEFFSDTTEGYTDANVYLHAKVIESVAVNSQDAAARNIYFDRTDLMEGYYRKLPPGADPVLNLSISAAAPGANVRYFNRESEGAKGQAPLHVENDPGKRWLKRNATHFVRIVIPRIPDENVFRLTRFIS
ncbi:MAG: hypothetical protein HY066_04155 [Betaproteobacteria bacterium]|nr:hypothetical protein [Betaproteobacteria bacterium]